MKAWCIALAALLSASSWADGLGGSLTWSQAYMQRGISRSLDEASWQLRAEAEYGVMYAGAGWAQVSPALFVDASSEVSYSAGLRLKDKNGALELGAIRQTYSGAASFDSTEAQVGLVGKTWSMRYQRALTDYQGVAASKGTAYWQVNLGLPLNAGAALNAHWGREQAKGENNGQTRENASDYSLGLAWRQQGAVVRLDWIASDRPEEQVNDKNSTKDRWVFSVSYGM